MELVADNSGFLVGSERVDLSDEQDKLQILRAIKADTMAMRKALADPVAPKIQAVLPPVAPGAMGRGQAAPALRVVSSRTGERSPTPGRLPFADRAVSARRPAQRPETARSEVAGSDAAPIPVRSVAPPSASPLLAAPVSPHPAPSVSVRSPPPLVVFRSAVQQSAPPAVATPNRANNGRFVARTSAEGAEKPDSETPGFMRRLIGRLGEAADRLREGASGLLSGTDQVDPAIAAAKEVGEIAAPLAAPLKGAAGLLFGPRDEQQGREKTERKIAVPWYRRLWGELRDLNDKPAGGSGGRMRLGGIGGLLMKLPGIGMLGSLLSKLAGGLKPLLGLLSKAALPLAGIFSAYTSFSTTTEEYAKRMGVELNGSLAQELGVRFVGVLGDFGNTLTFGLAGKFGEYIAPEVSRMVDGVVEAWSKSAAWVESKWAEVTGKFDAVINGVSKWFADKFGDVVGAVKSVAEPVISAARSVAEDVAEKAADYKDAASGWVSDKADNVASLFGGGKVGRKKALQAEMANSGITDPREQAMFMAQMDHESDGFRSSEESFKYRSADRLMAVSATVRKKGSKAVEEAMAHGPEAVAELMYGGRMGNTEKGDGYKFRGRGAIQLTGKDNYAAASKELGIDLMANPDLAADPAVAAKVAAWYWKKNNLGDDARNGDVTAVTRKINGGTNGLADRKEKYKSYLAAANSGKLSVEGSQVVSRSVTPAPQTVSGNSPSLETGALVHAAPPISPVNIPSVAGIKSAAPPAERQTVPPAPSVPRKLASNESKAPAPLILEQPLTQNLADRGLAQAATGGLGLNIGGR